MNCRCCSGWCWDATRWFVCTCLHLRVAAADQLHYIWFCISHVIICKRLWEKQYSSSYFHCNDLSRAHRGANITMKMSSIISESKLILLKCRESPGTVQSSCFWETKVQFGVACGTFQTMFCLLHFSWHTTNFHTNRKLVDFIPCCWSDTRDKKSFSNAKHILRAYIFVFDNLVDEKLLPLRERKVKALPEVSSLICVLAAAWLAFLELAVAHMKQAVASLFCDALSTYCVVKVRFPHLRDNLRYAQSHQPTNHDTCQQLAPIHTHTTGFGKVEQLPLRRMRKSKQGSAVVVILRSACTILCVQAIFFLYSNGCVWLP